MARFSINLRDLVILVADPSSYMSMLIHSMLRGFGSNKVLEARSSTSVLQILTNQKIDILICDSRLPPHGGLPLTRAIRRKQDNANRTIPILVMTSDGRETSVKLARDAGANMVHNKFRVFAADGVAGIGDIAATEDLDFHPFAHASGLDQLVDELLHREVAETRRLEIVPPSARSMLWKHEMIHSANSDDGIADAGRYARPEHRHQHFVDFLGQVELAREDLHHPDGGSGVEKPPAGGGPHLGHQRIA